MNHIPNHARIVDALNDATLLHMRVGVVTAVNGNRADVDVDGATLPDLARLGPAPTVGARVVILATLKQSIIAGVIA